MKRPLLLAPLFVIGPIAFMIILAYYLDKREGLEPGGETTYFHYCSGCHGKKGDGKGITAKVKRLKKVGFVFPEFWEDRTDEYILEVIRTGKDKMPSFEKFIMEEDRKEVFEYIKRRFKPKNMDDEEESY